jgi:Spy/CpxP family protein refolding chaperone
MSHNLVAHPAARRGSITPKLAGLGILLLVFLCGAVAGAMAHAQMHHRRPFWDPTSKTEYLKTVQRQLDLTPEQTAQMASILDDFAKYYQTVLSDGKARILNILNPEQRRKFEKMLKERPH